MVDVPPPDIGGRKAILELYAKKVGHLSSLLHSSYCIFPPSSYQSLTLLPYPSTVSLIISDLWYWNCASTYLQRILWRATYLPTYLPTYLTCYLPTLSSTYLPTSKVPLAGDVDMEQLARGTPGFTGAELYNLVNQAAVKASKDGLKVLQRTNE